jgi:hypothetical protein
MEVADGVAVFARAIDRLAPQIENSAIQRMMGLRAASRIAGRIG